MKWAFSKRVTKFGAIVIGPSNNICSVLCYLLFIFHIGLSLIVFAGTFLVPLFFYCFFAARYFVNDKKSFLFMIFIVILFAFFSITLFLASSNSDKERAIKVISKIRKGCTNNFMFIYT
jgi:hypothetical protein